MEVRVRGGCVDGPLGRSCPLRTLSPAVQSVSAAQTTPPASVPDTCRGCDEVFIVWDAAARFCEPEYEERGGVLVRCGLSVAFFPQTCTRRQQTSASCHLKCPREECEAGRWKPGPMQATSHPELPSCPPNSTEPAEHEHRRNAGRRPLPPQALASERRLPFTPQRLAPRPRSRGARPTAARSASLRPAIRSSRDCHSWEGRVQRPTRFQKSPLPKPTRLVSDSLQGDAAEPRF